MFLTVALAVASESCATTGSAPVQAVAASPVTSQPAPQPPAAKVSDQLPGLPPDPASQARVLTDYFKTHKLPLVAATVAKDKAGPQVVLYGFVGTPLGKTNAENYAKRFFHDPSVVVLNRIIVRPELLATTGPGEGSGSSMAGGSGSAGSGTFSEIANHQSRPAPDQSEDYLSYQGGQPPSGQQSTSNWLNNLLPLLMMGLMFIP